MTSKAEGVLLVVELGFSEKKFWAEKIRQLGIPALLIQVSPITWEKEYFIDCIQIHSWQNLVDQIEPWLRPYDVIEIFAPNEFAIGYLQELYAHLKCPVLTNNELRIFRNKKLFRSEMARLGFPQPKVFELSAVPDVFPFILKPVDWAGSIGVQRIENHSQLQSILKEQNTYLPRDIFSNHSLSQELFIEEYIEGHEISLEAIFEKGELRFWCLTEKLKSQPPYFIETGHVAISRDHRQYDRDFDEVLRELGRRLQLYSCLVHVELVLSSSETVVLEISLRPAGDFIPLIHERHFRSSIFSFVPQFRPWLKQDRMGPEVLPPHFSTAVLFTQRAELDFFSKEIRFFLPPREVYRPKGFSSHFSIEKKWAHFVEGPSELVEGLIEDVHF